MSSVDQLLTIVEWLQQEHNDELRMLDFQKPRGDLFAYMLLGKMLNAGMITEYTLKFSKTDGDYYVKFDVAHPNGERIPNKEDMTK